MSTTEKLEVRGEVLAGRRFESLDEFRAYLDKHEPTTRGNIIQVFENSDLRLGHDGLTKFAHSYKIDVKSLKPGQFVVFINTARDKIKVYTTAAIIAYMKLEKGRKVDLRVIQEIPRAFMASGKLDYDKALREVIESRLNRSVNQVRSGVSS